MGRLLQRLAVLLAFAGAFLVPALARAALLPACEAHDLVTRMPVEWLLPSAPAPDSNATDACTADRRRGPAPAEDLGDLRVPAMCDARGASAIAPQRIMPVSDARIEAASSCGADESSAIGLGPKHSPSAGAPPALADHAVLDVAGLVLPSSGELAPPYLPIAGGPLPAFARGIDHPPR